MRLRVEETAVSIIYNEPDGHPGHQVDIILGVGCNAVHVLVDITLGKLLSPSDRLELGHDCHENLSFSFAKRKG
jgi:hypothetical protein